MYLRGEPVIMESVNYFDDYSKLKLLPKKITLRIKNCKTRIVIRDLLLETLILENCENKIFEKSVDIEELIKIKKSKNITLEFKIDDTVCFFIKSTINIGNI